MRRGRYIGVSKRVLFETILLTDRYHGEGRWGELFIEEIVADCQREMIDRDTRAGL
jgi:hypothetical protein